MWYSKKLVCIAIYNSNSTYKDHELCLDFGISMIFTKCVQLPYKVKTNLKLKRGQTGLEEEDRRD